MKPQIIILLSTWNGEKYLRQQLDSLVSQTVIDRMQILVRDDGSSDETVAILKEYEKTGKLTFYQGKNLGSTQSFFQLLIDAPKADYYAFCDQDDYWLKEKVGKAVQGIEKIQEPALYCSRKIIVDQDLHELPRSDVDPSMSVLDNFIRNNKASGCTMVINHKLREIFLRYRPQMVPFHDSWIYKLALFFGKVVYSRESYIKYRQHGNNVTGAEAHGIQLLLKRLKHFDPTFHRYRDRGPRGMIAYATELLAGYDDILKPEDKKILIELRDIKKSFSNRLHIFLTPGLGMSPLYEYLGLKLFILLGWV